MARLQRLEPAGMAGWPGGGVGGGGFSPLSLSPVAWYDPSDLTTLFQDSGMTTPVTAADDPVGAMLDKSGNGNHLLQPSALSRPLYKTSGGIHWLEFDGSNDFMLATFALVQHFHRITAYQVIVWAANDTLWDGVDGNDGRIFMDNAGVTPDLLANAGGGNVALADEAEATDQVLIEHWDGANSKFAIDNNAYVTGDPGTADPGGLTLGAFGSGAAAFANIRVHAAIVTNQNLTDAQAATAAKYLAAKQGRVL